ncbi:MAG: trypsin-like peptidase domain-containing protein [Maioricimonas sp. JB049]
MLKCVVHASCYALFLLGLCGPFAVASDSTAPTDASSRITPIVRAVKRAVRSTVNIHSEKRAKASDVIFSTGRDRKVNGMGTGVVIDERGYIVTNHHVVAEVDSLRVTLFDGTSYTARVISFDSRRDLAIIKIEPRQKLQVMPCGTSSDLMLGEDVLAIGNAFGYEHTVTRGIVSALSRDVEVNEEQAYENLIQIDAAINPGNSGGPLLNRTGEMIGINVAIRAGAQKIGFAIPVDDARQVIARLINVERLEQRYHGVIAKDFKQGPERRLVVQATQGSSPAASAGLQPGDVIVRAGSVNVVDAADLERALLGRKLGELIDLVIRRGDDEQTVKLQLSALQPNRMNPGRHMIAGATTPPRVTSANLSSDETSWTILGLRLGPLENAETKLAGHPYHGGMVVTDVRHDSPAYRNGIQEGDILVGLHVWETVNDENVRYVITHPQLFTFSPLKFYILRQGETLYGHFQIASKRD